MIAAKTMQPDHKNYDLVQSAREEGECEICKLRIKKDDFRASTVAKSKAATRMNRLV